MKTLVELLSRNPEVSDYKINTCKKESFELFYVKGKLETARCTDTNDTQVTVYVDHGGCKGDAMFFVYPSTTEEELRAKIGEAVQNARLIDNAAYELPSGETGDYTLHSNFEGEPMPTLADRIAGAVFEANTVAGGSLNSVEVFVNHYTRAVTNSRGLGKTEHSYDAMVEAIPTFNGDKESVELYEQYNFNTLDEQALKAEIAGKMQEVKARYEAVKPEFAMDCPVVLNPLELHDLFWEVAGDLNYATVYSHGNLFHKGDKLQTQPEGDRLTLRMKGAVEGNVNSAKFDSDGLSLGEITLVESGTAKNYYGSNRFGQYLGEAPTGSLGCLCVEPGTVPFVQLVSGKPYLEIISMSGLQVDFFNDYIGGEIRLAYYHDGETLLPVTGISVSGKLGEVLNHIRFSAETAVHDGYMGPAKAVLGSTKIF